MMIPVFLWVCARLRGNIQVPRIGENSTATIQEDERAIRITMNREKVYSPALEAAKPTGMKPAIITNVPVSIGNAVVS